MAPSSITSSQVLPAFFNRNSFKSVPPNSVHLYNKALVSVDRGQLVIDTDYFEKINQFSRPLSFKVNKNPEINTFKNWGVFKDITLPINSAIISDQYLLKKDRSWKNNLFEIIKNLLPKRLETTFQLTLILNAERMDSEAVKQRFLQINKFINSLNSGYVVELGLIRAYIGDKHDRLILTNYYRCISGNSFDYFNSSNLKVDTYLDIFPLNSESGVTYFNELETFKNLLQNSKEDDLFGFCENRLLL